MRNSEEIIGNLIYKQSISFISAIDENSYLLTEVMFARSLQLNKNKK